MMSDILIECRYKYKFLKDHFGKDFVSLDDILDFVDEILYSKDYKEFLKMEAENEEITK